MTTGTFTLLTVIGSLFFLKLAIMVLVVVLLAKTLFADRPLLHPRAVIASLFKQSKMHH